MDFEQILPLLVASYRKGELVPFIGAGMSRPACVRWKELVPALEQLGAELQVMSWKDGSGVPTSGRNLIIVGIDNHDRLHIRIFDAAANPPTDIDETKLPVTQAGAIATLKQQIPGLLYPHTLTSDEKTQVISEVTSIVGLTQQLGSPTEPLAQGHGKQQEGQKEPSPSELIRRADRAVLTLVTRGEEYFQWACRRAVVNWQCKDTRPEQMVALAETSWPLVLSTNYDDWYPALACELARDQVRILGRDADDCQEVLTSLTTSTGRPILWALQGYLGGQAGAPDRYVDPGKSKDLAAQVVVGHHQYQKVINNAQHFRRAFADVFRRRSFLFLGSGLVEDYLVNLFSEILQVFGLGSLPHYAILPKEEFKQHGDFLQTRLSITPIKYDHSDELPRQLRKLSKHCSKQSLESYHSGRIEERYLLSGTSKPPAYLTLQWGELPWPGDRECIAFSAGWRDGKPHIKGMGWRFLERYFSKRERPEPKKVQDRYYIYQYGSDPVLAVAARNERTKKKDLRLISMATREMLSLASSRKIQTVHMGLLATGPGSGWDSVYSLIEMLRGARQAADSSELTGACPSLVIHINSSAVWFPLQARKLNVEEILSGYVLKFWAETKPRQGDGLRLLCIRPDGDTISVVAQLLGFRSTSADDRAISNLSGMKDWVVEVTPRPSEADDRRSLEDVWSDKLIDIGVVNGSTLEFRESTPPVALPGPRKGV
jgi:hypothetical protein